MRRKICALVGCATMLSSCQLPAPQDGSSYYYASSNPPPAAPASTATSHRSAPVPYGGYATGSGPTAMPQGNQFMHQQNESGPFGSRSSSTVIQSSGGVQSYQTIGGVPVYPGAGVPGYVPNQPFFGTPTSQQPVYVPGVGGNPGSFVNPTPGVRVR